MVTENTKAHILLKPGVLCPDLALVPELHLDAWPLALVTMHSGLGACTLDCYYHQYCYYHCHYNYWLFPSSIIIITIIFITIIIIIIVIIITLLRLLSLSL